MFANLRLYTPRKGIKGMRKSDLGVRGQEMTL